MSAVLPIFKGWTTYFGGPFPVEPSLSQCDPDGFPPDWPHKDEVRLRREVYATVRTWHGGPFLAVEFLEPVNDAAKDLKRELMAAQLLTRSK